MLQRKQSIWLLVAAFLNACVIFFDMYRWHEVVNGVDTKHEIRVTSSGEYSMFLLVLVCSILPAVTIFMYKQRKRQVAMAVFSIVAVCSVNAMMLSEIGTKSKESVALASGTYWIGAALPIVSLAFLILAIFGIRKDEKLVKSMDRLR